MLVKQELSDSKAALVTSQSKVRHLATMLANHNNILARVQESLQGVGEVSIAEETAPVREPAQSEVPNMFDPEGNDLYEGYEDEDVGMEKGPDIVPGYHKVDDENNM